MAFDADSWRWVKEQVADALELPAQERERFLQQLEHAEPAWAAEVRSLVDASESRPDDLLESTSLLNLRAPTRDWTGELIGSYRIQRFQASGGMGEVYEALQEGTGRRVALKLLSRDSPRDRERFRLEGRLLGRLEHDGIAQVLDADVHRAADGSHWPYLALEFVDGEPLTSFARRAELSRPALLELFAQLCRTLEHAHRKGIVHRDLKPDNILVAAADAPDGVPRAKVLDFGIAALLEPEEGDSTTRLTRHGDLIGTLAYMAPEQVAGDPSAIDARTDVHALGVLLFELLTGRLPFELTGRSLAESMELLRRALPPAPSHFDRSLRGDLDTIVATALAKEPERRYPSAAALADDVERHLSHEPIMARPASRLYRAAKFTRRHRALVSFTLLSLVLLFAGIVGTSIGLWRAEDQRQKAVRAQEHAEAQAVLARELKELADDERGKALDAQAQAEEQAQHTLEVNRFFGDMLNAPAAWGLGKDASFRDVLDALAPRISTRFADRPVSRSQMHLSVGWAYFHLYEAESALKHLTLGRDACVEAFGPNAPNTLRAERELLHSRLILDPTLEDAIPLLIDLIERLEGAASVDPIDYLLTRVDLSTALQRAGRFDESLNEIVAVAEEARRGRQELPAQSLVKILDSLGQAYMASGQYQRSLEAFEEVENLVAESHGQGHPERIDNRLRIATTLTQLGRLEDALAVYEQVGPVVDAELNPEHPLGSNYRRDFGNCLLALGRYAEAVEIFDRVLNDNERVLGSVHRDTLLTLNSLIVAHMYLGRWEQAESLIGDLLERSEASVDAESVRLNARGLLSSTYSAQGRFEAARDVLVETHRQMSETLGPDHPTTIQQRINLGSLLHQDLRDLEAALPILRDACERWHAALPEEVTTRRLALWHLGRAQAEAGELQAARETLRTLDELADQDPFNRVDPEILADLLARVEEALVPAD